MFVKLSDGREFIVQFMHHHYKAGGKPSAVSWISGLALTSEPKKRVPRMVVRQMTHKTVCTIVDAATKAVLAQGEARCSTSDQFRKKTGILLSLRDATAQLSKEERTAIWEKFMPKKSRTIPPEVNEVTI